MYACIAVQGMALGAAQQSHLVWLLSLTWSANIAIGPWLAGRFCSFRPELGLFFAYGLWMRRVDSGRYGLQWSADVGLPGTIYMGGVVLPLSMWMLAVAGQWAAAAAPAAAAAAVAATANGGAGRGGGGGSFSGSHLQNRRWTSQIVG